MSAEPEVARAAFHKYLSDQLAVRIGTSQQNADDAVAWLIQDWSIEMQTMRPITDPHDRFIITTPWEPKN